jgi:hypothetical protein
MGSRLDLEAGLKLEARAPLPVKWKLLRDGKVVAEGIGRPFRFEAAEPGNYRAGEEMIWVLSNPLYIRPARKP